MARHYVKNPAGSVLVTDQLLAAARDRADAAQSRLREAELADPSKPGWDAGYQQAEAAVRAAARRVEALERLRAAQVERSGQRDAAVTAAAADLKAITSALTASRDQVSAAAAEHLRTLAAVAAAAESHNVLLAKSRARLAELGLRVRDDLVDVDQGQEHPEGVLEQGLRADGTDFTPVPGAGVVAYALRQVFGQESPVHPLAQVGKYRWRSFEVEARPDGLRVPALKDVGAVLPPAREVPRVARASISDLMPPAVLAPGVSGYTKDPPLPKRRAFAR